MKVKTGEIATVSMLVDLDYCCSACGHKQRRAVHLKAQASVGVMFGVAMGDAAGLAREKLAERLSAVQNKDPSGFKDARFNCYCEECGHMEPWARFDYPRLRKLAELGWSGLILTAFFFFVGLNVLGDGNIKAGLLTMLPALLCILAGPCVSVGLGIHNLKMMKLTAALPSECVPDVKMHKAIDKPWSPTFHRSKSWSSSVQAAPAEDRLQRQDGDARLVKLTGKQKRGPVMEYSFAFSRYDADFCRKCAATLMEQAKDATKLYRLEGNGTQKECTNDPTVLAGNFKALVVNASVGGQQLKLILRPGTDTITAEAGTDISENDITILVDRAVKIATGL